MNGNARTLMSCLFAVAMGLHAFGFTMILKHSHGHEECLADLFLHYDHDEHHACHHHDSDHNQEKGHDHEQDQEDSTHHHACSFCKQLQGLANFLVTFQTYPPHDFRLFHQWEPMMPENPVLERDILPKIA
jgi:hypothetical protein